MENMDNLINDLIAKLLATGSAEFSQNGLNIKTTYNNGNFNIKASFVSPEKDKAEKLITEFETYIKSLTDEFFLETAESFEDGALKKIQDKLNTKQLPLVKEGISEFMAHLRAVAAKKIQEITKSISAAEKELTELIEIRDSYTHVLNKKF